MRTICLLLAAALATACQNDSPIGENDPDAAGGDSDGGDGDGDSDAAICACAADSCGTRECGRSDCGYPCGTCAVGEHCFAGGTCSPGPGPGTPCIDAFGGQAWEGDEGFRVCPSDPDAIQQCTCGGGGPDAWGCVGDIPPCIEACVGSIPCGTATCGPTELCLGCSNGTDTTYECRPRNTTLDCAVGGLVLQAYCDGDEDCAGSERCMMVEGDTVALRCTRDDMPATCGQGAGYFELCGDLGDCPGCATTCNPITFADHTTPAYDRNVCR